MGQKSGINAEQGHATDFIFTKTANPQEAFKVINLNNYTTMTIFPAQKPNVHNGTMVNTYGAEIHFVAGEQPLRVIQGVDVGNLDALINLLFARAGVNYSLPTADEAPTGDPLN